jgi:hypothetical protein
MTTYNVLVGIDYNDKRAEAGDVVSDLPSKSISWLLEQGLIELAEDSAIVKVVKVSKKDSLEEAGE